MAEKQSLLLLVIEDNEQMTSQNEIHLCGPQQGAEDNHCSIISSLQYPEAQSLCELSCYTGKKEWEGKNTGFNYIYLKTSEK